MKKHCAFTICTRSYIGMANALRNSFLLYNEEFDFYVIFADYVESEVYPEYVLSAKNVMNLPEKKFLEMAFKYNVTEFCTSVKPFGHLFFFNKGYDSAFYFDPDILFFSRFNEIYQVNSSVYLTPHIVKPLPKIKNSWEQEQFLKYGTFNCGFVGFRNNETGKKIAYWWAEQLKEKAFSDSDSGLYTDQKWMDLVPSFVDLNEICIIRNLGCDFAPWNYSERKNVIKNGVLYAQNRENESEETPICFVHFSAYNYKKLLEENIIETKYDMKYYEDEDNLVYAYKEALNKENTLLSFNIPYAYGFFENGEIITGLHRRLFREALKDNSFSNPFAIGQNSFYSVLRKSKLLSDVDFGRITEKSILHVSSKEKWLRRFFKFAFIMLGVDKYTLLIRKIKNMSKFEENRFLLKKR